MKKLIIILMVFFLKITPLHSQAILKTIEYNDKQVPGLELKLPNKIQTVQETVLQKLKEINYTPETKGALFWKTNKIHGYYIYKQVALPELNNRTLDLYFKATPRSDKEKNKSNLYMLVSKGYDNFVSPQTDTTLFNAAKRFLNSFVSETAAYKKNLEIDAQEKSLSETQKIFDNLLDDERDLLKKLEEYQTLLQNNKLTQKEMKNDIELKKEKLQQLKNQLDSIEQ